MDEPKKPQVGEGTTQLRATRRMSVIAHGQGEVAGRFPAGQIKCILASSNQLDDGQGEIREFRGISFAPAFKKCFKRRGVRIARELVAQPSRQYFEG